MRPREDDWMPTRHTLLQKLKNLQDDKSWQEFFDLYAKLIYGVACRSGLAHDEAEEVVQETVLSVSRKIEQFEPGRQFGSFKAWLGQLIRWRITDQVRKRRPDQIAREHASACLSPGATTSTPTQERLPDPAGDGFQQIWEAEWKGAVLDAALARLKIAVRAEHYQVFQMSVLQERPPEAVAKMFGITTNLVYLIKHRLSARLREEVEKVQKSLD